jgi:hypothetical protein
MYMGSLASEGEKLIGVLILRWFNETSSLFVTYKEFACRQIGFESK